MEVLCAQYVSQRGLRQEPRGVVRILHIGHGDCRVGDTVVDHGVHRHGHGVFGQDLQMKE